MQKALLHAFTLSIRNQLKRKSHGAEKMKKMPEKKQPKTQQQQRPQCSRNPQSCWQRRATRSVVWESARERERTNLCWIGGSILESMCMRVRVCMCVSLCVCVPVALSTFAKAALRRALAFPHQLFAIVREQNGIGTSSDCCSSSSCSWALLLCKHSQALSIKHELGLSRAREAREREQ